MTEPAHNLQAIIGAISRGQATIADLQAAFSRTPVFAACETSGELAPLATDDGMHWAALFTFDLDLSALMHDGVQGVRTTGGEMLQMIWGHPACWGIVVDPSTEHQFVIEPDQIAEWARVGDVEVATATAGTAATPTGIIVGVPTEPLSTASRSVASQACMAEPAVLAAWELLWKIPERHSEPAIVLVVFLHPEANASERATACTRVSHQFASDYAGRDPRVLDVADLDACDGMFNALVHSTPPVFNRGSRVA